MSTPFLSTDFTFGVEFEFGIRFKKGLFPDYTRLGPGKIHSLIKETLILETGLELMTEAEIDHDSPPVFYQNKDFQKIYQQDLFNTWAIGTDTTISFRAEEHADRSSMFVELELITPVMKFGPKALKEIDKMLTALKKHFEVIVNLSCGLHVHVGNGIEGLSFQPLQHLMATIWTFEPQILSLLRKSRNNGKYCGSLHERSLLGVYKFEGSLLDVLLSTSDANEVVGMFDGYDSFCYMAFQLEYLLQPFRHPVKRTIEFRAHEGSMDSEIVLNWASFVVELVSWAHKINRQDLKIFLSKHIDSKVSSIEDLFKEIGFPQSTVEFYREKVKRLRKVEKKEAEEKRAIKKKKAEEKKARDAASAAGEMVDSKDDNDSSSDNDSSIDTLESGSLVF
ncbi:uncharacterized protein Bfra_005758 [Botrytis fragariae]|uniref:Amidoligase enzyme n=1 Tax=Botrytis fragariae TaxID=1964551 RepID=A0A8H6EHD9_9HELO|nr:uncharacterized protein Bfra_005758 [Botrytis fragariae]KAF5872399.1 hypothetical protein Bfra_005758 [Botrytis fragariae]